MKKKLKKYIHVEKIKEIEEQIQKYSSGTP